MPVPGNEFGRYRIVGRHSFHAAGFVVQAREERTGAERDLWLLTPAGVAEPGLRGEIVRAATAVRKVRTPHLVPLHEFGEVEGQPFFARGVVDGVPLRALGNFDGHVASAVACIAQVGEALHALHEAGLTDGALGPSRVLVSGGAGPLRARLRDAVLLGVLIRHRVVVGPLWEEAVDYRAPEVLGGEQIDERADIYALGGLLWTALTGEKPFATYVGHQLDPVPQLAGDAPAVRALNTILSRSLAKRPADRYATALDMVDALRLVPGLEDVQGLTAAGAGAPAGWTVATVTVAPAEAAAEVPAATDPTEAELASPYGAGEAVVLRAAEAHMPEVPAPVVPAPVVPVPVATATEVTAPVADEDEPAFLSDGWRAEDTLAPVPLPRTALPDDVGHTESDDDTRFSGPSPFVLGLVLVAGLLMLAAVLLVRHFDLVTLPGADATGTTSMGVVGPQSGSARAIA